MSVLEKLKALDEQRVQILKEAKSAALQKAQDAIGELRQLGFHYSLIESSGAPVASGPRKEGAGAELAEKGLGKVESFGSQFDQSLPGS